DDSLMPSAVLRMPPNPVSSFGNFYHLSAVSDGYGARPALSTNPETAMSLSNTSRRTVLALALSLFAAGAMAQAQPAAKSGFVPEVGQSGKDVVWVPTAQ